MTPRLTTVLVAGLALIASCNGRSQPKASPPRLGGQALDASRAPPPGLPAGSLPVALPKVAAAEQRSVAGATALVFVELNGAVNLGQLSHGATPYHVVPREQDAALRAQLFGPGTALPAGDLIAPERPVPPSLVYGTVETNPASFDTLVFADAGAASSQVVEVLGQLVAKRTGLAVATDGGPAAPGALQFTFGAPPAAALPVHIWVVLEANSFTINVLDSQTPPTMRAAHHATFDRAELIAALRVVVATAPQGPVHIDLAPATTMQRLVDVVTAIASVGVSHVQLAGQDNLLGSSMGTSWGHSSLHVAGDRSPTDYANLRPRVAIGTVGVKGPLDQAIVRRFLKRNLARFKYCYEKELLNHPKISGAITTTFTITDQGAVVDAHSTGFDASVAACVAQSISAIEFPRPAGKLTVTVPITFAPNA